METETLRPEARLQHEYFRLYPDEVADVLEEQPIEDIAEVLRGEQPQHAAEALERLSPDVASRVLERLTDESFAAIVPQLDPSRAGPLLGRLPEGVWEERLTLLDSRTASELAELMSYPPDTAGGIMDPRATTFQSGTTAGQAVARLRAMREEEFEDIFVVDPEGKLLGTVALEDLAIAYPDTRLDELVSGAPAAVPATTTLDEVLEIISRARPGNLPVVDFNNQLLGVIHSEELLSAAEEEASADLQTMVGVGKEERALSAPLFSVRKRLPWLHVNLVTAFLAAAVVGIFEGTIAQISALAVLLPVVAGQSGNSGAQALAVTMRGLALREVRVRHWGRLAFKEARVGFTNGLVIGAVTAAVVFVWSRSWALSAVIGLSMVIAMTIAGLAGTSVPLVLKALGQDPAQSSSIVLTTVTDVVGFFSFLGLATLLSQMLISQLT